ncbi:SDR family NAD(P)-dependent oxidoreductase [Archangium minus]|uniref:SDR family NAD(P)-dependent oxidoreductase n=1 Tax=Archangium minus TaxID=83450 RepID=A0ABY9X946_9BACT|nr:SDR family NAD(P)-dependent oxidoreductase [Archangium minus]
MDERNLSDANFVFVGGTSGIGLAAARAMGSRGAAILILGRDPARGEQAVRQLQEAGAREAAFLPADISSIAGVARAVEGIKAWRRALHGLVHTAMTAARHRVTTSDGFELAFGLQYLARYALNRALVGELAASGDGRIVHVGAKVPSRTLPDLEDLQFEKRRWSLLPSLMSSQVLGYLHVQEAAKRWRGLPVRASIACVGMTNTDTIRGWPWAVRALYRVLGAPPERAAENTVRLLTVADSSAAHGAVLFDPKHFRPTPLSYDSVLVQRTWELSEEWVRERGLAFDSSR